MKKIITLFAALFMLSNVFYSQEKYEVFPDDLLIQPFTANMIEPKVGFLFETDHNDLRLDIGNSMDIVRMNIKDNQSFSFGADFFTYTKLRSEDNFHFPVDAVDYLFGVNFGYKKLFGENEYGARLRISHISAHLVDGHYDKTLDAWRDGHEPRVYSREFIELMPFYRMNDLRVYAGFTYLFHVTPDLGKDSYQCGFDYYWTDMLGKYITPYAAYDLKLVNIDTYTGNNSLNLGVKFGKPYGKGFSVYFHYYNGKSVHGEYYEYNREYSAIGINLDL